MDPTVIAASGSLALLLGSALVLAHRSRRTARSLGRRLATARDDAARAAVTAGEARERGDRARTGEREASWAATTAVHRARRFEDRSILLGDRLAAAETLATRAEQDLDDLRDALRRTESDLSATERDRDETLARIALLETEAAAAARALQDARTAPQDDETATSEVLEPWHARVAELEAELAALTLTSLPPDPWQPRDADEARESITALRTELAETRDRHDAAVNELTRVATGRAASIPGTDDRAPLAASLARREAEIADLEERLAALSAARQAEVARLSERVAALHHLYAEIERRDHRIADLEQALQDAQTGIDRPLDPANPPPDAGESAAAAILAAEIRRLRTMLATERERNVRLGLRLGATPAVGPPPVGPRTASVLAPLRDVTLVKGIGRVIAGILATQGITTLSQVAALSDADIDRVGPLLPVYPGRIRDDRWVQQARDLLASG